MISKTIAISLYFILAFISLNAKDIIITSQPVSVNGCIGSSAQLSLSAESLTEKVLSYTWFKDFMELKGENSPILKIAQLQYSSSGIYFCRISDGYDTVNTYPAVIYTHIPTTIVTEPEDIITGTENEIVEIDFKVHSKGYDFRDTIQSDEFINIQWYEIKDGIIIKLKNNNIYKGVNSNSLSIQTSYLADTSFFYAEINDECGSAKTRTVKVMKNIKLINVTAENFEACEGSSESIKASISNPAKYDLEYRWFKNGKPIMLKENIRGILSGELFFEPIGSSDSGIYKLEVRIRKLNYKIYSNEIKVVIVRKPNLVCFSVDTMRYNTGPLEKQGYNEFGSGWKKDVRLAIYYEDMSNPVQFDIYRNGNLIATKFSQDSEWHLGNIYFLNFDVDREDSARYFVIAHNKCGIEYSDTLTLFTESYCDPFHMKHHICETDSVFFRIDYINKNDKIELDYYTLFAHLGSVHGRLVPWYSKDSSVIFNKNYIKYNKLLEYNKILYFNSGLLIRDQFSYPSYGFLVRNRDSVRGWEAAFCCFETYMTLVPLINRQPEDRTTYSTEQDTVFKISFHNYEPFYSEIFFSIYFMKNPDSEPEEIFYGTPTFGTYYYHIKEIDDSDEGYYFAKAWINNECPIYTDTVKVEVVNKGMTNVNSEASTNFSIYPNPAEDFIIIPYESNGFSSADSEKVQFFDIFGKEISDILPEPYANGKELKIDISGLSAGVYFVKLNANNGAASIVRKFVKM